MAKYEVKFSCGHTHTIDLFGSAADRERKIKYFEECGICPECKKETKEKQIAETELELQLPQIEGISEKQINYAKSLRYEVAHKNMDTINSFREQISTCGHTISEIAEVAVKKPHSRLAIGYFCCIETNASKIIDAFK